MAQGDGRVNWKDSHLYFSREKEKKKKTKNNRPSLSLSLFPSLSPLRFSAHDTRGKRAGGLSDIREYSIPVHDTSRRGNFFPRWAAVHREEAARSGFWVDERGYAARWGRLVTDSLSPGVATPTPPLRHPTPFPATPSTHRPLRGSTPLLLSHVLCTRAYRQTLSPSPPLSLSLLNVHLSGVEHKVGDRLSPTLPPDAIRYIPWRIVHEGGEDDGIVAGWELWGRWELEISSLPDFDVDRVSRAREFQVCVSFLNVAGVFSRCNL